ncbi:MAG TPA: hypothetical protein VM555_06290 [Tahibacter sp.]|nr:hypothetical protein [Tahibacter sp.]
MKLLAGLAATLVATFIALVVAINHFNTLSFLVCPKAFDAEGILCRFASLGITAALIPICGVAVGVATWLWLLSREKRAARDADA